MPLRRDHRHVAQYGGGKGITFTPSAVAGLHLWLKADSLVLADGAAVASWPDSSTNAYAFSQATGSKQPSYVAVGPNSRPAVSFGSDDLIRSTTAAANFTGADHAISFFMVGQTDATDFATAFTFGNQATTAYIAYEIGGSNAWRMTISDDAAAAKQPTGGTIGATFKVMAAITSGTAVNYYSNGALAGSANQDVNVGTITLDQVGVGCLHRTTLEQQFWNGDIAEILVYNEVVSAANRGLITGYLGNKYGISVV